MEEIQDLDTKLKLIDTLITVTSGKVREGNYTKAISWSRKRRETVPFSRLAELIIIKVSVQTRNRLRRIYLV